MKNIVLCADGTGNKGGYGADTNVYKVYKAVDIINKWKEDGKEIRQITFYDQGVGVSESGGNSNKYITALKEAVGLGFGAKVHQLYTFLGRWCINKVFYNQYITLCFLKKNSYFLSKIITLTNITH